MKTLIVALLVALPAFGQPWDLPVETAAERRDLQWALDLGAKLFGSERPGLVALRDRLQVVDAAAEDVAALPVNGPERATALWAEYVATHRAPVEWSGSIARGDPGELSAASLEAILRRINFFRMMAGLEPVENDAGLNARCQAACLVFSANPAPGWELAHTLEPGLEFYSAEAAEAARNSCIDRGEDGVAAINDLYRDFGFSSENAAVPHRQWLNLPQLQTVGIGAIPAHDGWPASICIYVRAPTSAARAAWAWPSAGVFPLGVTPERWSVYHPSLNLSGSVVTVNGAAVPNKVFAALEKGFILVFRPPYPFNSESVHRVEIAGPWPVSYTVERARPD